MKKNLTQFFYLTQHFCFTFYFVSIVNRLEQNLHKNPILCESLNSPGVTK